MKLMKNKKGFTLVELLLVIAIIGILASVIFIMIGPARKKARIATFKQHMKDIVTAGASCIDGDGTIQGGVADGATVQFCDNDSGFGYIPEIKTCKGGSGTINITVTNGDSDDFNVKATCPVSSSVNCYADCNINGCKFGNTDGGTDGCPQT